MGGTSIEYFSHQKFPCSHYAVTHKPWVWKLLMGLSDSIVGISSYCWRYQVIEVYIMSCIHTLNAVKIIIQHTFGHHPYTNIDRADPDITMHPEVRTGNSIFASRNWNINNNIMAM